MLVDIADNRYQLAERLVANPACGEDFCDSCGDCLACYGDDWCPNGGEYGHLWVVYHHKAAAWRERHPEASLLAGASDETGEGER